MPLYLDKKSETLRVIQQIRDEAHRFGITHHRKRRSKGTIKTELSDIKGISDSTSTKLLRAFGSVKQIREKSEAELAAEVGKAKAKLVWMHFHPGENGVEEVSGGDLLETGEQAGGQENPEE